MKTAILLTVTMLLGLLFSGCTSAATKHLQVLPDASYKSVKATITGKFSSTQVEGTNVTVQGGELKAGTLHLRHSNVYVPLIELELEAADQAAPAAK